MSLPLIISIGISTLCVYKYLHGLWDVDFTPGPRPLFSPLTAFGAVLPSNSLNPGTKWAWILRRTAYFKRTHDVISFVPWLVGKPAYYTSSLNVMKQLLGNESKIHLIKPEDMTTARLWGHSVTSASGEEWRRHRKVVQPAFNSKTYTDIWRTVRSVYQDMVDAEGWNKQNEVVIEEVNAVVIKFTLNIICRCGFAVFAPWSPKENGSEDDFPEALRLVSETLIPRIVIPKWAYKLPVESLRRMDRAWKTIASTVTDLIDKRKNDNLEINHDAVPNDLLNCLVASWINEDKNGLDDHDVVANMFSIMFSGHETTSSGIVTTLAYLAIYSEEQQKAYEEIRRVFSENDPSEIIDSNKLPFTLFCFWEAQRMCPSALMMPRQLTEDVVITVTRPKQQNMLLKKGSFMIFELIGLLRNPETFPEPDVFKPSRWENVSEHDVGAFGYGPRACLGRKFAQTEALAFLSTLLYEWKVEPNLLPGETLTQYEERFSKDAALVGTAFVLGRVPIKLSRRKI